MPCSRAGPDVTMHALNSAKVREADSIGRSAPPLDRLFAPGRQTLGPGGTRILHAAYESRVCLAVVEDTCVIAYDIYLPRLTKLPRIKLSRDPSKRFGII